MVTRSKTSQKELYFVSSYGVTLVSRLRRDSTTMSRPLARGDLDYRNRFHWQNSGMKDSYPELLIEYPPEGFESGSKTDESGWFARSPVPTMTLPFFIVSTLLPLPSPSWSLWELGICGLPQGSARRKKQMNGPPDE